MAASIELLTSGFLRREERDLNLYMNIPVGLTKMIHQFYPLLLFKFGDCNQKALTVTEDGTVIKGTGLNCNGYLVYADLGQKSNDGLNQGIHLWSIKRADQQLSLFSWCFCSIGIMTEKNDELINNWHHRGYHQNQHYWISKDKGFQSHNQQFGSSKSSVIMTMKLDCDNWTVTYYENEREVQKDDIEPNQSYYLAMLCCAQSKYTHFCVVESDILE